MPSALGSCRHHLRPGLPALDPGPLLSALSKLPGTPLRPQADGISPQLRTLPRLPISFGEKSPVLASTQQTVRALGSRITALTPPAALVPLAPSVRAPVHPACSYHRAFAC